jgi:hypothetical protein
MSNEGNSGVVEQTAPDTTKQKDPGGRPAFTDIQFQDFLDEMSAFLKMGDTLYSAMDSAGLLKHKDAIYEKMRSGDWFSEKVKVYQSYPAKLVKNILVTAVQNVSEKVKQEKPVSEDEMKNVRFMAEKYRPAQVYFVTRSETQQSEESDVGKVLDNMETDYDSIGREAKKQMVAAQSSIQNKGQVGSNSNIQTEPGSTSTSH